MILSLDWQGAGHVHSDGKYGLDRDVNEGEKFEKKSERIGLE
jgi:hypothetical protein